MTRQSLERVFIGDQQPLAALAVQTHDIGPPEPKPTEAGRPAPRAHVFMPRAWIVTTDGGSMTQTVHLGQSREAQVAALEAMIKALRRARSHINDMWDVYELEVATGKREEASEDDDFYPF